MPDISRLARAALAAVLIAIVAGCSGGGPGGTSLQAALARVSDTANNRSFISYDDTAELVGLVGKNPAAPASGYGPLRGMGAGDLLSYEAELPEAGISLFNEDYAITAGSPPSTLTLIAGGQDASAVTQRLTKLGFKKAQDGTLASPTPPDLALYPPSMSRVKASQSDVLAASPGASLSQAGSPSGATLADDAAIKALAACLGNVAAALMVSGSAANVTAKPTEIAVGVSQPASASATPHVVVCVSWPTATAAAAYAANVRKALATGSSLATGRRYSATFSHATVTRVGGSAHVVEWQADEPTPETIFEEVNNIDLPALPDCARLPAAAAARIIGC